MCLFLLGIMKVIYICHVCVLVCVYAGVCRCGIWLCHYVYVCECECTKDSFEKSA